MRMLMNNLDPEVAEKGRRTWWSTVDREKPRGIGCVSYAIVRELQALGQQ